MIAFSRNRILKFIYLSAGAAVLTVAITYTALLIINWNDQPLSPLALEWQTAFDNRPAVPDADNAYVYTMGFSVPPDQDPVVWGSKRIAWNWLQVSAHQTAVDSDLPGGEVDLNQIRNPLQRDLLEACRNVSRECAALLEKNDAGIQPLLVSEKWLLDRYKTLLLRSAWQETGPLDAEAYIPSYVHVLDGQKLLLLEAWTLAPVGNVAPINALLQRDLEFWRNVQASSETLLNKLIAVAAIKRNFEWTNLVYLRLNQLDVKAPPPEHLTVPFSSADFSMQRCFRGEWIFASRLLLRVRDDISASIPPFTDSGQDIFNNLLSLTLKPFLQVQASRNQYAEYLQALAKILDVPASQYPAALELARALEKQATTPDTLFAYRYNPVGRLLFAREPAEFTTYAARVTDLEGMRRAALTAIQLRQEQVSIDVIAARLAEAGERNPYTSAALEWDMTTSAIVFTGLAPPDRARNVFIY